MSYFSEEIVKAVLSQRGLLRRLFLKYVQFKARNIPKIDIMFFDSNHAQKLTQPDAVAPLLIEGRLRAKIVSGEPFEQRLEYFCRMFADPQPARDQWLEELLNTELASPAISQGESLKVLEAIKDKFFNKYFSNMCAIKCLELKKALNPTMTFDEELKLVQEYFSSMSPARDDILMSLMNRVSIDQYDGFSKLFYSEQRNLTENDVHAKSVFYEEKTKVLIEQLSVSQKREFTLWMLGIIEKPLFMQEFEALLGISFDSLRKMYGMAGSSVYPFAGESARNQMIEEMFVGAQGILNNEKEFQSFMDSVISFVLAKTEFGKAMPPKTLKKIFNSVINNADKRKRLEIVKGLALNFAGFMDEGSVAKHSSVEVSSKFMESVGIIGIKVAQILASSKDVDLPTELRNAFMELGSKAKPLTARVAYETLRRNPQLQAKVLDINGVLGSASIKVVFDAMMDDNGTRREIALKIKRPEVAHDLGRDLEMFRQVCGDLRKNGIKVPDGFEHRASGGIREDADFIREIENTKLLKEQLEGLSRETGTTRLASGTVLEYLVPDIYGGSNENVIFSEKISGIDLNKEDELVAKGVLTAGELAELKKKTFDLLMTQYFSKGLYLEDPHGGNFRVVRDKRTNTIKVYLIDVGAVQQIPQAKQNRASYEKLLRNLAAMMRGMKVEDDEFAWTSMFFAKTGYLREGMDTDEFLSVIFYKIPEGQRPYASVQELKSALRKYILLRYIGINQKAVTTGTVLQAAPAAPAAPSALIVERSGDDNPVEILRARALAESEMGFLGNAIPANVTKDKLLKQFESNKLNTMSAEQWTPENVDLELAAYDAEIRRLNEQRKIDDIELLSAVAELNRTVFVPRGYLISTTPKRFDDERCLCLYKIKIERTEKRETAQGTITDHFVSQVTAFNDGKLRGALGWSPAYNDFTVIFSQRAAKYANDYADMALGKITGFSFIQKKLILKGEQAAAFESLMMGFLQKACDGRQGEDIRGVFVSNFEKLVASHEDEHEVRNRMTRKHGEAPRVANTLTEEELADFRSAIEEDPYLPIAKWIEMYAAGNPYGIHWLSLLTNEFSSVQVGLTALLNLDEAALKQHLAAAYKTVEDKWIADNADYLKKTGSNGVNPVPTAATSPRDSVAAVAPVAPLSVVGTAGKNVVKAIDPVLTDVSGAVQAELAKQNPAAEILHELAQQGVVMVADSKDSYEALKKKANEWAAMGVPVTIVTNVAPDITAEMAVTKSIAGKRITAADGTKSYVSTTLESTSVDTGLSAAADSGMTAPTGAIAKVTVIITDKPALGANLLIEEANETGILQGTLSTTLGESQKAWVIVTDGKSQVLKNDIEACKDASQVGVILYDWDSAKEPADTLRDMKALHDTANIVFKGELAKQTRERKEADKMQGGICVSPESMPGDFEVGNYSNMVEALRGRKLSNVFVRNADNVTAVDMMRFIETLGNIVKISKAGRAQLVADANSALRPSDTADANIVSADRVTILQSDLVAIANKIIDKAISDGQIVKLGKAEFNKGEGVALLKAFALQQLHNVSEDMLLPDNGGTVVGRDLDNNPTAKDVIDSLAIVNAVRLNINPTVVSQDLQTQFSDIANARKAELQKEHSRIAADSAIFIAIPATNPNLSAIALLAVQNNFKVHIVVENESQITANVINVISATNAAVVVKNRETAQTLKDKRAMGSAIVADVPANVRLNNASNNSGDFIDGILDIVKEALAETPEAHFNTGARYGSDIAANLAGNKVSADSLVEAIEQKDEKGKLANAMKELNRVLTGAKPSQEDVNGALRAVQRAIQDIPTVPGAESDRLVARLWQRASIINQHLGDAQERRNVAGNELHGLVNGFIGTALLIALTNDNITKEEIAEQVELRNALAQAFLSGVKLSELGERLDLNANNTTRALEYRDLVEKGATSGSIAASLQNKYARPAMMTLSEDDLKPESLSVDARLMLALFEDSRKLKGAERFNEAVGQNMETLRRVFTAG